MSAKVNQGALPNKHCSNYLTFTHDQKDDGITTRALGVNYKRNTIKENRMDSQDQVTRRSKSFTAQWVI
jgi:hypothetical protein